MKVSELIAILESAPGDALVIVQSDAEGNGYSPLCEVDSNCIYVADSTWSGEVYSIDCTAEDADCDSEEEFEEFKSSGQRCVTLVPVN